MTSGELAGRVAVVFGAGSGGADLSNGEAAAVAYAEAGAVVATIDINPAEAERVAAKIVQAGGTGLGIAADITNEHNVAEAVTAAAGQLGTPESCTTTSAPPTSAPCWTPTRNRGRPAST